MESIEEEHVHSQYGQGYFADVDAIREQEYPLLNGTTYLDHAGTTLYAKSFIESFSGDMISNLFGNPHSMSVSSHLSTERTENLRLRVLQFFSASPDEFDVVFVANATAAIKLIAESFRDSDPRGFWYGYHVDSHTSVIGVRELAAMGCQCFDDTNVDTWISELGTAQSTFPKLFAFPAQSNMNGRRLPLQWSGQIRSAANGGENVFTLLDAASFLSTAPLDLGEASTAPDFTALSFYKIFGFPDLGALIVRKSTASVLERRKFFGGGTVDMVIASGAQWHAKKETSIHERLEDGTLPFHSIIALDAALQTHKRLYGSMSNISAHTGFLAQRLYDRLSAVRHFNGTKVCRIYQSNYGNLALQGPIIAFNMKNSHGQWIPKSEIEKLATVRNIQLRSGSVCNPGGTAMSLGWAGQDLRRHYATGLRCGDDHDVLDGRPTGILRVSIGAMTNLKDIDSLTDFVDEFYVEKAPPLVPLSPQMDEKILVAPQFYVESLTIFPIKGCAAFKIPEGKRWEVKKEGLAWDRVWYLVHEVTGFPLKQNEYPQMASIHPFLDMEHGILRITCSPKATNGPFSLEIPLIWDARSTTVMSSPVRSSCRKGVPSVYDHSSCLRAYASPVVSAFFTEHLGVSCTLARFSPLDANLDMKPPSLASTWKNRFRRLATLESFSRADRIPRQDCQKYVLISDEMSLLIVSRSSINCLNETIKANTKHTSGVSKAIGADLFKSNIVVAERVCQSAHAEHPYAEDHWSSIRIGQDQLLFDTIDPCQRCQMLCVDQVTGAQRNEILAALPKIRKVNGRIQLGRYATMSTEDGENVERNVPGSGTIMVGDVVLPSNQKN